MLENCKAPLNIAEALSATNWAIFEAKLQTSFYNAVALVEITVPQWLVAAG